MNCPKTAFTTIAGILMSKPKVILLTTNSRIIPSYLYVAVSVCNMHEGRLGELLIAGVGIVFSLVMSCLQI